MSEKPAPADVAAPPGDAERTDSGLAHKLLQAAERDEARPRPHDRVRVHFTAWAADGRSFDASPAAGVEVTVRKGPPGWVEALQLLGPGERRRFWLPARLAFENYPGPVRGDVVYDIELLEVIAMPEPPAVPEDVAGVPGDAKRTASGLAYRVLEAGSGRRKPATDSRVEVHYSAWLPDRRLIDSSVTRGQPAIWSLDNVMVGLAEALREMTVGERRRLWLPQQLTRTPGREGTAKEMLVYDVELLAVVDQPAPSSQP